MEFKLFDKPDYAAGRPGDAAWYKDRAVSDHINEDGMHRRRLLEAADLIQNHFDQQDALIADWGAGNGGLLRELKDRGFEKLKGYDLSPLAVAYAKDIYDVDVSLLDIVNVHPGENATCIVMTEFLEHLVSPHELVERATLGERNVSSRWLVASSPCNEDPSSFYEYHLWAWTGTSFADMFSRAGWDVLRHYVRADCNTQFVLAERK